MESGRWLLAFQLNVIMALMYCSWGIWYISYRRSPIMPRPGMVRNDSGMLELKKDKSEQFEFTVGTTSWILINLQALGAVFRLTFDDKGWPIGYGRRGKYPRLVRSQVLSGPRWLRWYGTWPMGEYYRILGSFLRSELWYYFLHSHGLVSHSKKNTSLRLAVSVVALTKFWQIMPAFASFMLALSCQVLVRGKFWWRRGVAFG